MLLALTLPALAQDEGSSGGESGGSGGPTAFLTGKIDPGLGPLPGDVFRSTPQSAMESFFAHARKGDFAGAAHLLSLYSVPENQQAKAGPILARQLLDILDRKVVIDWSNLPDRPDGMLTEGTKDNPMIGVERRSIVLDRIDLVDHPVEVRLDRVKPPEGPAVWLFSSRTVADISALHQLYGPTRMEKLLPDWMHEKGPWALMWWEIIGLPLVAAIAAFVGWVVSGAMRSLHGMLKPTLFRTVIRAARWPAILFAMTFVVSSLTSAYYIVSGRIDMVLTPLTVVGYTTAALSFLLNGVDVILDRIAPVEKIEVTDGRHAERREMATRIAAFRRVLIVVIVLVGGGVVLSRTQVFHGFGLSLLASAGAVTLIFGFAARAVLGNIIASLQIALNRSARIGDKLLFRDMVCHVERINFTFVQLRVWTDERLIVPVSEFVSEPFQNWTLQDPSMTRLIALKLAHDVDVAKMREIFDGVLDQFDRDDLQARDNHSVVVTDHDVFGTEVSFCLACQNADSAWELECRARELLLARIAEAQETDGKALFPEVAPAEAA